MLSKAACYLILCLLPLCGCANEGNGSTAGDCNTSIGFKNTIYRVHNAVNQAAPAGVSLGTGELLDCDGSTYGRPAAQVYAVKGVDPALAISITGEAHGIYVAEGFAPYQWPSILRTSESVVTPSRKTERAVSDFVEDLQGRYRSKISPAVDWEENTILVAAAPPVPDELKQLSGRSVAGLHVNVFAAAVTVSEYEAFIKAVGRTNFPGKERVCSFSLPADSSAVTVNVIGVNEMSTGDFADLRAQLEALTEEQVLLREAGERIYLGGSAAPHTC